MGGARRGHMETVRQTASWEVWPWEREDKAYEAGDARGVQLSGDWRVVGGDGKQGKARSP